MTIFFCTSFFTVHKSLKKTLPTNTMFVGKAKKLSRRDFTLLPVLNLLSIQHLALLKRACLTCLQYNRTKIHNRQNLNIKCNLSSSRCVFQIFQNTKKICFPMFLIVNLVRFPIFTNQKRCGFQCLLLLIWCVFPIFTYSEKVRFPMI